MATRLSHLRPIAQTAPLPTSFSFNQRKTIISTTAQTAILDQQVSASTHPQRKKAKPLEICSDANPVVFSLLTSSKAVAKVTDSLLDAIETNFPLCPYYQFLDVRTFARFRCLGRKYSYKQRVKNYFIANPHQMEVMIWRNQQSLIFHGAWQEILTGPRGIETLSLSGTSLLAGTPLRTFSNVKAIKLFNCRVSDQIFEDIASLTKVTSLHVEFSSKYFGTPLNWKILFGNPNLESLTFITYFDQPGYAKIMLPDKIVFGPKIKNLSLGSFSLIGKTLSPPKTLESLTVFRNPIVNLNLGLDLHTFNCEKYHSGLLELQNLQLLCHLKNLKVKICLNYQCVQALISHPTLENITLNLMLNCCIERDHVPSLNAAIFLLSDSKFKTIHLIWNNFNCNLFCERAGEVSTEMFVNAMLTLAHKIYRVYIAYFEVFTPYVLNAFAGREFLCTHFFYVGLLLSSEVQEREVNIMQLLRSFPKVTSLMLKCLPLRNALPIEKLRSLRLDSNEYSSDFLEHLSKNVQTNLTRLELIQDSTKSSSINSIPLFQNANLRLHDLTLIEMKCNLSTLKLLSISQRKLRHLVMLDEHYPKEFIEEAPKILAEFSEIETLYVENVVTDSIASPFHFDMADEYFQE